MPFSELLAEVIDNRGRTCPTASDGIALIATNCIRNDCLYPSYENVRFVSKDTYDSWFRGHPKPGDLIFVLKGTPGRVCLAPDPIDFCIAQDMVALRVDAAKVYPPYLFALLRSSEVQTLIEQMHVGTLIPHFKKGDFDKLLLPVDPDRQNQKFVGDHYFNLSKRIDINRRMSETLEAMARALFRSWFLDFDPVRAKAEGRWRRGESLPGLPAHLYDLFPDSFENSELGKIPGGWQVGRLDDAVLFQRGFDLPSKQRSPGNYPVFAASGMCGYHNQLRVVGPGVVTGRSGVLGNVFYVASDFWPLNTTLWVKEFRHFPPAFAFYALRRLNFGRFNAGSAVPTLNRNHIHSLPTLLPPPLLVAAFEGFAKSVRERLENSESHTRILSRIRDQLLPKLISGELRVPLAHEANLRMEQYS